MERFLGESGGSCNLRPVNVVYRRMERPFLRAAFLLHLLSLCLVLVCAVLWYMSRTRERSEWKISPGEETWSLTFSNCGGYYNSKTICVWLTTVDPMSDWDGRSYDDQWPSTDAKRPYLGRLPYVKLMNA